MGTKDPYGVLGLAMKRLAKEGRAVRVGRGLWSARADCVNPCCSGGYVPAGEKGDVQCPDCLRENRAKTTPVTMIGGPKP